MTTLPVLAPASLTQGGTISTGETILFAVVAGVIVVCGFGLLTAKRAVSAAVNMIMGMCSKTCIVAILLLMLIIP